MADLKVRPPLISAPSHQIRTLPCPGHACGNWA